METLSGIDITYQRPVLVTACTFLLQKIDSRCLFLLLFGGVLKLLFVRSDANLGGAGTLGGSGGGEKFASRRKEKSGTVRFRSGLAKVARGTG